MKQKTYMANRLSKFIFTYKKGITLISLVITIIVLLILATVAISIAIDSDGLFARARKAAEDWNTSVANEERAIENVFEILNEVNVGGVVGGGEMQPPTVEVQSIKLEPPSLSLTEGETAQITATITPSNATNQNITWSSESNTTATVSKNSDGKTATVTAGKAGTTNIVATVDGQTAMCSIKVKSKGANEPVVPEGAKFKYVTWEDKDGDGTWEEHLSNTEPDNWYNYEEQKWANVKTTSTTPNDDGTYNEAYWVWIPRYAYKVPEKPTASTYTQNPTFQIAFLQGNTNNPVNTADLGEATIKPASEIKDTGPSVGDWVVHPAFTFGDQELSGIWVAKFEASSNTPNAAYGGGYKTGLYVNVKPNVPSWRRINVSSIFTVCQAMNSTKGALEGAISADLHMMKNVEWGAVVYLAQSKYGKNGQVWINPNSDYKTGQAGTGPDVSSTTSTSDYNTKNGQEASTTGNVYGVYDMSGGAYEYVAAYLNNSFVTTNGYSTSLVNAEDKYKDVYAKASSDTSQNHYNENKNKYGDAVYETSFLESSSSSWQADDSVFPTVYSPVFVRGGDASPKMQAGVFFFNKVNGDINLSASFRPVWVVE